MAATESALEERVKLVLQLRDKWPENIAVQSFDLDYYKSLSFEHKQRLLLCMKSGIETPTSQVGCYANFPDDYDVLKPFFTKVLEAYHKVDLSKVKHINNWSLAGIEGLPASGKLDISQIGLPPLSMRVRTGRNLKKFPLPASMTQQQRVDLEIAMGKVFDRLISMPDYGGRYVSITPGHPNFINTAEYDQLVKDHIMFKDMSKDDFLVTAGISKDWPYGRGCYISSDKQFIVWIGEEDHLRIICMKKGSVLNEPFDRLKVAIDVVEELIDGGYSMSSDFGVVTSCPTNIGTAMRASVHIALPKLTADGTEKKCKEIAKPLGLSVRGLGGEHTPIGADGTVDISPSARFCISEAQILVALYRGVSQLKAAEDAL